MLNYSILIEVKTFQGRPAPFSLAIRLLDPKKGKFPQGSHAQGRKRLKPGANLSPQKDFTHNWTT